MTATEVAVLWMKPSVCSSDIASRLLAMHQLANIADEHLGDQRRSPLTYQLFADPPVALSFFNLHWPDIAGAHNDCPAPLQCIHVYDQMRAHLADYDRHRVLIVAFCMKAATP